MIEKYLASLPYHTQLKNESFIEDASSMGSGFESGLSASVEELKFGLVEKRIDLPLIARISQDSQSHSPISTDDGALATTYSMFFKETSREIDFLSDDGCSTIDKSIAKKGGSSSLEVADKFQGTYTISSIIAALNVHKKE